ncbi:MAG: ABC transporter permease [Candidatus Thorarchaeota archaeon]
MIYLYYKLISVSFKSQMQHRASFLMLTVAYFISTFVDIVGIWVLFDRFKIVKGWTLEELMLIYGIVHMGFAIAEGFTRGFDKFSQMVKNGDFDRILLRPLGTLFQVATRDIQIMRVGRFLQGSVVLIWGFLKLKLSLFPFNIFIILLSIIGTATLFCGLFILQATLSFWTTETLEIMNITTYGGVEAGQYPISIYKKAFRLFFIFIVPIACVGYYPISIMLKHETFSIWVGLIFPLAGIVFLYLSCKLWKFGVRHYHSTGS